MNKDQFTQVENQYLTSPQGVPLAYAMLRLHMDRNNKETYYSAKSFATDVNMSRTLATTCFKYLVDNQLVEDTGRTINRAKVYRFPKDVKPPFQEYSVGFLYDKTLDWQIKDFLIRIQPHLIMQNDREGVGVCYYTLDELSKKINLSVKTIRKRRQILLERGIIKLEWGKDLSFKNLPGAIAPNSSITLSINTTLYGQMKAWKNAVETSIDSHETRIKALERELAELKAAKA